MADKLNTSLSENLITLLCYDDVDGKLVANMVDPTLFEGDYRTVATRAIEYWGKHGQAPGVHTPDLFADIIDDPSNRRANSFKRILRSMIELSDSMNTAYVIDQLKTFTRLQKLKSAILESAEQLNSHQEQAIENVEQIWNNLIRSQDDTFDAGLDLTEIDKVIDYTQAQQTEFTTGIEQLDKRHVVPSRGTALLILAGTGRGKTWALVHLGKRALMQRKKVLHISLEMSAEQVAQRYYQSLFSVSKRKGPFPITTIERDAMGHVKELSVDKVEPAFTFDKTGLVRDELEQRIMWSANRYSNVIIKRFASMSIADLDAYLDNLEITKNFIPDIILLDYIGLVKTKGSDYRLGLGSAFKDFRSICINRHIAGVTAQQSSKEGAKATRVNTTNVAEDWSLAGTADGIWTFSQTEHEKKYNLGRLYVGKFREEEDQFGVILTQNYKMGQFVLDSVMISSKYFEILGDLPEDNDDDDEDEDEAGNE